MFAGSFRGITQTVPLAIYERFSTDFTGALALSAVLVAVSAALLLSVKLVGGCGGARRCCALRRARGSARSTSTSRSRSAAGECLALAGPVRAPARRRVLRVVAGLLRPERGRVACGGEVWLDTAARHRPRARAAPLRLRLPGVRAVPAPERLAERRLPAARAAARRAPRARARAARALRDRRARRRAPAHAVGRRAPARGAGARARARPERAAARRAAVGARRAHARARRRASWRRCCARPACRRCSSPTTSPRRRCSATASA